MNPRKFYRQKNQAQHHQSQPLRYQYPLPLNVYVPHQHAVHSYNSHVSLTAWDYFHPPQFVVEESIASTQTQKTEDLDSFELSEELEGLLGDDISEDMTSAPNTDLSSITANAATDAESLLSPDAFAPSDFSVTTAESGNLSNSSTYDSKRNTVGNASQTGGRILGQLSNGQIVEYEPVTKKPRGKAAVMAKAKRSNDTSSSSPTTNESNSQNNRDEPVWHAQTSSERQDVITTRSTLKLPRITLGDIRRQFVRMFANVCNSADLSLLASFLETYGSYGSGNNPNLGPFRLKSSSNLVLTKHLTIGDLQVPPIELRGIELVTFYLQCIVAMAPDFTIELGDMQLRQRLSKRKNVEEEGDDYFDSWVTDDAETVEHEVEVIAKYTLKATRVYELNPIKIVQAMLMKLPAPPGPPPGGGGGPPTGPPGSSRPVQGQAQGPPTGPPQSPVRPPVGASLGQPGSAAGPSPGMMGGMDKRRKIRLPNGEFIYSSEGPSLLSSSPASASIESYKTAPTPPNPATAMAAVISKLPSVSLGGFKKPIYIPPDRSLVDYISREESFPRLPQPVPLQLDGLISFSVDKEKRITKIAFTGLPSVPVPSMP